MKLDVKKIVLKSRGFPVRQSPVPNVTGKTAYGKTSTRSFTKGQQYATDVKNFLFLARLEFLLVRETGCVPHYFQYKRGHILIFSPKSQSHILNYQILNIGRVLYGMTSTRPFPKAMNLVVCDHPLTFGQNRFGKIHLIPGGCPCSLASYTVRCTPDTSPISPRRPS